MIDFENAGWQKIGADGHTGIVGPFWTTRDDNGRKTCLTVEERHCNTHLGTVHGGVLMTFADVGMGIGVVDVLGAPKCATADLQIQFLSVARVGAVLACRPELMRQTKDLVFMRGLISTAEKAVASISGIWKIL